MTFKVYLVPGSPYSRAVLAALEEKRAEYSVMAITGGLRNAEHQARHPFCKVPAIEHDGFELYETQAILRYIDRAFAGPALTPAAIQDAARMDQLMNINDCYLFQGVGNVIGFQRVVKPMLLGLPTDEAAVAAAMPQAQLVYEQLERFLGEQAYFAGSAVSLADLMIAPQVDFFLKLPEWPALTDQRPRLRDWLARMNQRPSMQNTTAARVAQMAAG
jgi:glutathione S-transferase